jgi:hypothetical protein
MLCDLIIVIEHLNWATVSGISAVEIGSGIYLGNHHRWVDERLGRETKRIETKKAIH